MLRQSDTGPGFSRNEHFLQPGCYRFGHASALCSTPKLTTNSRKVSELLEQGGTLLLLLCTCETNLSWNTRKQTSRFSFKRHPRIGVSFFSRTKDLLKSIIAVGSCDFNFYLFYGSGSYGSGSLTILRQTSRESLQGLPLQPCRYTRTRPDEHHSQLVVRESISH